VHIIAPFAKGTNRQFLNFSIYVVKCASHGPMWYPQIDSISDQLHVTFV
jgi:hypothetical protein